MPIRKTHKRPTKARIEVDLWRCEDLREMISEAIHAHVKDVELAKRLEHVLADEVAYNDGGGGGVAVV